MMQTHEDSDGRHEFLDRLKERASTMVRDKASEITAGKPGEPVLAQWERENFNVVKRPDDEQGILRISVGGGCAEIDYLVFRGAQSQCIALLGRALRALRNEDDSPTVEETPVEVIEIDEDGKVSVER